MQFLFATAHLAIGPNLDDLGVSKLSSPLTILSLDSNSGVYYCCSGGRGDRH